jgi:hypothetical protein
VAREALKSIEGRDPAEVLQSALPEPIPFETQRDFVRSTLNREVDLRARGAQFIDPVEIPEGEATLAYRGHLNSEGSPSEKVAAGYVWTPGTELSLPGHERPVARGNGRRRP